MGHLGGAVVGFIFYFFAMRNLENKVVFRISLTKEEFEKAIEKKNEPFKDQITQNIKIRDYISKTESLRDKEEYLQPYQIPNANICSPPTYNTEDEFCLRCEWFGNCMLRKSRMEKGIHENK